MADDSSCAAVRPGRSAPDFNAAETAYQAKQWPAAADGFAQVISSTDKPWLKDWIAPRLLDAAGNLNRFDTVVTAWITLAKDDPATAASLRPNLPTTGSFDLNAIAARLSTAAQSAGGLSQRLLLGLLLDVDMARQDATGAAAVANQLRQAQPTADSGAIDPAVMQSVEQETRLALANAALNNRQYDQAISIVDSAAALIVDPPRQSQALLIKAQALEAKAAASGDKDAWKDAALAYLRVYVHFRDGPGAAHSPQALIKAAQIEEARLGEKRAALTLYQKVVNEYKDSLEAAQATPEANRLAAALAAPSALPSQNPSEAPN
jgi:tetratricopeptide (TPR) repeat protein